MKFPEVNDIPKAKEMTSAFTGYQHIDTCPEGAFFDMKNITTEHFPVMSPRHVRGFCATFTNFLGAICKEGIIYWCDDGDFYASGTKVSGFELDDKTFKTMVGMGTSIVIFPDKKYYDTKDGSFGSIDANCSVVGSVTFTLCGADGTAITWHDASYYNDHTPVNGDYKMETVNGRTTLSVYSSSTGLWAVVTTTYMKIAATYIGNNFSEGDGVKITVDLTGISWDWAKNVFPNDEGSGKRSNTFTIKKRDTGYIVVPALLDANKTISTTIDVDRKCPDMSFVVECQNRLWGCSEDGHEIYCCKLGDYKNWNVFQGISTDSWVATIGSDGVFTGAIAYLGYPIFFKEDTITRVSISSIGAHQTKEQKARGVQLGSDRSLVQVNEVLYYKGVDAVYRYDGSFPEEISQAFGQGVRYFYGIGGSINSRYYLGVQDAGENHHLFVYDANTGLWAKEDNLPVIQIVRGDRDIYLLSYDSGVSAYAEYEATKEDYVDWMVESGKLSYDRITNLSGKAAYTNANNHKFLSKINIRMQLDIESRVSLFLCYDSSDVWEFQWNMNGRGQQVFTIPVRPHRCDHVQYKLIGHGEAKIFSVTKEYTQGSEY